MLRDEIWASSDYSDLVADTDLILKVKGPLSYNKLSEHTSCVNTEHWLLSSCRLNLRTFDREQILQAVTTKHPIVHTSRSGGGRVETHR